MGETTIQPEGGATTAQPATSATSQGVPSQQPAITQPQTPVKTQEGTSERTAERFEKLTESNKRLYEANQLLQQELFRKAQLEQQIIPSAQSVPGQPKIEDYITTDSITGEQTIDSERLKKAMEETQQRAVKAETAVKSFIQQQQQFEEQKQTTEAFKAYPELDPADIKYDAVLSKRTRAFLIDSMVNPADYKGRALTFKEAADLAKGQTGQTTVPSAPASKAESKENKENLENKQQASLAAQGVSSSAQPTAPNPDEKLADLQMRSRKGDMWAVAQRLSSIPHTGTPTSSKET